MKNIDRIDLRFVLLSNCCRNYQGKKSIKDFEESINSLLDELYNVNEPSVYPLNIKETYVLRKAFGILDNGVCQSKSSIADELGYKVASVNELIERCMEKLIKRVRYSYKLDARTRMDKMSSIALSDRDDIKKMRISSLGFDTRIFNIINKRITNIVTFDDLLTFGIGDLQKHLTEPTIQKILDAIHNFGLKFIEELTFEEKRKIISNSSKEEIMNSSIAWIEMSDDTFKKISKVATTIKRLIDSINNKTLEKILSSNSPELVRIIEQMKSFGFISRTTNDRELPPEEELLNVNIEDIEELSTRTKKAFIRNGRDKIRDIIELSEDELKSIRNIGETALKEVRDYLHKNGLFFTTYEAEKLKEYSSSIHEQLEASTVTELSKKYKALVAEKQQLQTRSAQLDTEISEVLSRLNGKDINNEQSTK